MVNKQDPIANGVTTSAGFNVELTLELLVVADKHLSRSASLGEHGPRAGSGVATL
jgi:hypothetical protein